MNALAMYSPHSMDCHSPGAARHAQLRVNASLSCSLLATEFVSQIVNK